jgi:DMSO/TMAO reductase YedYZ molybdopterin-dependent catalytic subunit
MDVLMASGFITPPSIHYVRNHGAVPKLVWESHTITINGLVEQQLTISMEDLVAMPSVTIPVTLVCAGASAFTIVVFMLPNVVTVAAWFGGPAADHQHGGAGGNAVHDNPSDPGVRRYIPH